MSNLDLLTWYIMLSVFVCGFTVTMYVIVIVKIRYSMETKEDEEKVLSMLKMALFIVLVLLAFVLYSSSVVEESLDNIARTLEEKR